METGKIRTTCLRVPAVYMRGGTSKGLFFHEKDLPQDTASRDALILAAYGSPDPNGRQLDGMGGGTSVTSKVAIIRPAKSPGHDVEYLFGQVSIDRPLVSYKGNCGNLSSAVGPFAIDEGILEVREPVTTVRILQLNTGKTILAEVPVQGGKYNPKGGYSIDGVPGTGSKITLRFLDPGGSVTGQLLPTGNALDTWKVDGVGKLDLSILDAGNPVVFVRAVDLGLQGTEIEEIDRNEELKGKLEAIRAEAAVRLGFAKGRSEASQRSQAVPKIALVAAPKTYRTLLGSTVRKQSIHLLVRMMSMGNLHRAYAVTGAICTAAAAMTEGSVVQQALGKRMEKAGKIILGHPSGRMEIEPLMKEKDGRREYLEARLGRTARRLMEGWVLVPETRIPGIRPR